MYVNVIAMCSAIYERVRSTNSYSWVKSTQGLCSVRECHWNTVDLKYGHGTLNIFLYMDIGISSSFILWLVVKMVM